MNWKNVKVLVTGAGGFIGSHLAEELLLRGAKVRALVHYNSRSDWGHLEALEPGLLRRADIVAGDVSDTHLVREVVGGRDVVFHLAALIGIPYSYHAPASYVSTNVTGTLNVLQACLEARVRKVVHTSTSEVYGTARYVPIDEAHPLQGQSPYSASKIAADKLAESFHLSFGLPVTVVRPFNTFGPRQSARAVLPTILTQLISGRKEIRLGSQSPVRDFNYVADTVSGFLAAAESSRGIGEVVNLGTGKGITIRQAAAAAMRVAGKKARIRTERTRVRPAASEVLRLVADNRKARRLLKWRPRHGFETGLRLTAAYLRERIDSYKPELYST